MIIMNSSNKKENSFFTLFKAAFPKSFDFNELEVYHVKSFKYTDSNLDLVDKNISNSNLVDILESLEYNAQSDNIDVYYVINSIGQSSLYFISDPVELFSNGYIVKQYDSFIDDKIIKLDNVQRIS
jgi:hypothetical protein